MTERGEPMRSRTKEFALRVMRLVDSLPAGPSVRTIGNQLIRSGTSPGANYRSACRSRSPAEFRSKLGIVEEELDQSIYWMELLIEGGHVRPELLTPLMNEASELLAMTVASIKTTRAK